MEHTLQNPKSGLSQEGLKLIACATMLLDHVGAILVYPLILAETDYHRAKTLVDLYHALRIIGRIAFPIYCFLLVEGGHHTRSPKKYGLRLAVGMVLSELPFDLAVSGQLNWQSNSVMLTLLLGFLMLQCMNRLEGIGKIAMILPFFLLAEWLKTDYGGNGIAIIAMLALTRGVPQEKPLRIVGFALLLNFGAAVPIGRIRVTMELFGLLALVPIFCYDGSKRTGSKAVQWAFYLFYPVHLLILWAICKLIAV